mgnify:CR=1 FL=1
MFDRHKEKLDNLKANRARADELKWADSDIKEADTAILFLVGVLSDLNRLTR